MQHRRRGLLRFILDHGVIHTSLVVFARFHEAANTTCTRRRWESGRKNNCVTCGESPVSGELSRSSQSKLSIHRRRLFSPPIAGSVFLVHARPAALDQDDQHDAKKHSGNDTNDCHTIHCIASLLLVSEIRFERLRDHNAGRTKSDDK